VNRLLLSIVVAVAGLGLVAADVEAKRLGGGGTSGLKRSTPPAQAPAQQVPAKPAAAPETPPAAAAPATPPKRSWLGPIAGIAAGLGIAALMSHFGMGAEMGSLLTMLLVAGVAFFAIRFVMQRLRPGASAPQGLKYAGIPMPGDAAAATPLDRPLMPAAAGAPAASTLPAGFDAPAFERVAKLIFIRMQAANDSGDLEDLRQFSTPEMFANFRLELQDRKGAAQQTDVVQLDAQVVDVAREAGRQIVSVRFHGLVREEKDAAPAPFDEVWHLVKPDDGSREWAIAGIAQSAAA